MHLGAISIKLLFWEVHYLKVEIPAFPYTTIIILNNFSTIDHVSYIRCVTCSEVESIQFLVKGVGVPRENHCMTQSHWQLSVERYSMATLDRECSRVRISVHEVCNSREKPLLFSIRPSLAQCLIHITFMSTRIMKIDLNLAI